MIRLETLHGRPPALAALVAIGLLFLMIVITPIYGLFEGQNEEHAAQLRQLAIYRAEMGTQPALQQELADLQATARNAPGLIRAPNADLAAAHIQSEMKNLVIANAGEIRSAEPSPAVRTQGFETISIAYDLTVPLSHLRALLYAVETRTPYLVLDNIEIVAPRTGDAQAADPVLELRWIVRGYRWATHT